MKVSKSIDFSGLKVKKLFEPSSKEYKILMSLNDEGEWNDYVNIMLNKGVSVIYDASGDFFVIKPVAFEENNNRMKSKKNKLGLDDFAFLFKSKKVKNINEADEKQYLLYDDEDETDDVKELPSNDLDIESSVNDLISLDDEDMQIPSESLPNNVSQSQPDFNNQQITLTDIENIVKQLLSGQNTVGEQETTVPDALANGEATPVQDTEGLIDVLGSEFQENKSKINVVENKIENDESYLDILNGDCDDEESTEVPNVTSEFQNGVETIPSVSANSSEDFEIYEPEEKPELLDESDDDIDILNRDNEYEDGDLDLTTPIEEPVTNNSTITAAGVPVKIQITGWLITVPEVNSLAESIKKKGAKLRKLESSNAKELNLYIESNKKIYKIKYEDKSKFQSSRPWSIKDKKFASLSEAVELVSKNKLVNNKEKFFKLLIGENKDLSNRSLTNIKESTIFEDFRNDKNSINYVPGWNVKSVGSLNLKNGLNEVFSNITEHSSKEKNTLFKTKDGKYFLLKGNLGEASQKGEKRQLVDLEGKKDYGVGQVIGIYENNYKGLGQVMYKIKRTSIPLLTWKRK